jgi:hypothetical protein
MESRKFPALDIDEIADTREAMHAYARVLGDCLKASRPKRKHWWHASLRPSLTGMTTGVVHANIDFEIELDFRNSQLLIRSATGEAHSELLRGQPVYQLVDVISDFLVSTGISGNLADHINVGVESTQHFGGYSEEQANLIGRVFSDVAATMSRFRAEVREETSPIQIWPHHFDLSMLWLPGEKIAGQDPDNEEYADKQMNFGFVLGDDSIAEPYFYVTAYPLPDVLPSISLPAGSNWQTTPFAGAVLRYESLTDTDAPADYLLELWQTLLSSGRTHMLERVA